MARQVRPWLQFGMVSASLLAACGSEDGATSPSMTGGSSSSDSSLGGNSASAEGGAVAGGAASSQTGGTNAGGTNAGGTNAGGTNAGGANAGGTTTGGATTGGAMEATGGTDAAGATTATGGALTGGVPSDGGAATSGGATSGGGAGSGGLAAGRGPGWGTGGARPRAAQGGGRSGAAPATGGTANGGSSAICGTANEASAVTMTCPEGQVIESVLYASYGNPTGDCGSFVTGDCHSASTESAISTLCVGRASCTVPASNGTFGDPCSGTPKSVAVELACVVGEPTVAPAPFKGLANSPRSEIEALGATWCYQWSTRPNDADCADPYFVPMIWGAGDVAGGIQDIGNAGYTTVLGFNEPNKSDQANMSVAEAISLWPEMTSNPNLRVGSPAVSDDGRAWLEDFMDQARAGGLRVDFIAMHWYGWNAGSCVASQFEGAIRWAEQWGLPIWITEFGCMGSSNPDEQTLLDFFPAAVAMLQGHPLVERYAWYPWNDYNHLYLPDANNIHVITPLGELFQEVPAYR